MRRWLAAAAVLAALSMVWVSLITTMALPDFRSRVTAGEQGYADVHGVVREYDRQAGRLLIDGRSGPVWLILTPHTSWLAGRAGARPLAVTDLHLGQLIEAVYDGALMKNLPAQAKAKWIREVRH